MILPGDIGGTQISKCRMKNDELIQLIQYFDFVRLISFVYMG